MLSVILLSDIFLTEGLGGEEMDDNEFIRVLGVAEYEAKWVQRSNLIRLRASGILPCSNYKAQLEQRPGRHRQPGRHGRRQRELGCSLRIHAGDNVFASIGCG